MPKPWKQAELAASTHVQHAALFLRADVVHLANLALVQHGVKCRSNVLDKQVAAWACKDVEMQVSKACWSGAGARARARARARAGTRAPLAGTVSSNAGRKCFPLLHAPQRISSAAPRCPPVRRRAGMLVR